MLVRVEGKVQTFGPMVLHFPQHHILVLVVEPVVGVGKGRDHWVLGGGECIIGEGLGWWG